MRKRATLILTLIAAAAITAVVAAELFNSGFSNTETTYIYIDNDDNIDSVRNKIKENSEPDNILAFDLYSTLLSLKDKLHTGKYEVDDSITMLHLVRNIRNHNEVPVRLVVPSVRTIEDMAEKLSSDLMVSREELLSYMNKQSTLQSLSLSKETLPSIFIPNTYEIYWDARVEDIIARFDKENKVFWNEERISKIDEVNEYVGTSLTKTDIVTLASIVDSETANNGEKPLVAGLYLNRLKINMPLQSDPTVIFALKDFSIRRVLHKHLETDSPYNTYKNTGLPPGPIRIPSIAGIDAVLNHAHHNYIYMCAKEDFSGTHNFASSYAEHQRNAARYANALNKRNIH